MNGIVARLLCIAAILLEGAELRAQSVGEVRAALVENYVGRLAALAQWCETQKFEREAEITRGWLPPLRPLVLFVPIVKDVTDDAEPSEEAAKLSPEWQARFGMLRQTQAEALFALVAKAVDEQQYSIGFELLHETLRENPDHEAARRLLGYRQRDGRWLTVYEEAKAKANQVWDSRFGWLPKAQLERYANGERFLKGRWISAEEDARLRGPRGWEVVTEHYRVQTNHSLEEGVRLAARLERLYDVWR
ncbi:MAG TPA: hypothetical protein VHB99_09780, partial [Pirellulales bacterium]|nr:hypothetical protein [Pirellulales bacterium]